MYKHGLVNLEKIRIIQAIYIHRKSINGVFISDLILNVFVEFVSIQKLIKKRKHEVSTKVDSCQVHVYMTVNEIYL